MTPAALVKALRAELGEDRVRFGRRWRKSGRTIENWEQGRRVPDAYLLGRMQRFARLRGVLRPDEDR
jgi:DNA-binding transcriptional regulator YiaG